MEKVKFLSDYRGMRTNEICFTKGSVTVLANDPANELVEMGVAKIVVPDEIISYDDLTKSQLKELLESRNLKVSGSKKVLVERLIVDMKEPKPKSEAE